MKKDLHEVKIISEILADTIPITQIINEIGVYFLINNCSIVYIGSSKNVSSRINAHRKTKEFDSFYILPCEECEMLQLEADYIAFYAPIHNKMINFPEKYRYLGQVSNLENQKMKIEVFVLGGKIYTDYPFER